MMDNKTYHEICRFLHHGMQEQEQVLFAERIRIATSVLPAICENEICTGYHPKQWAELVLDLADALIVEAVERTNENAQRK